mgnify:FL=1
MKEKIRCGETHYGDSPYRSDVHGILLHGRRGRLLSVLYTAGGEGLHPAVLRCTAFPAAKRISTLRRICAGPCGKAGAVSRRLARHLHAARAAL